MTARERDTLFVLSIVAFGLVFVARMWWVSQPGLGWCLTTWSCALVATICRIVVTDGVARLSNGLLLCGISLNAAATIANGGYMPVSLDQAIQMPVSVWVPLEARHRLQALCDVHWGASIGDMVLCAGVLLMV